MIEQYFKDERALQRLRSGPAGPFVDGFAEWLAECGYGQVTGRVHVRASGRLGRWLAKRKVRIQDLDEVLLGRFLRYLPRSRRLGERGGWRRVLGPGAGLFLRYLRLVGAVREGTDRPRALPAVLDGFRSWMRLHRGATETTIDGYLGTLSGFVGQLGSDAGRYDPIGIRRFVVASARSCGGSQARNVATAVRMFLRYLVMVGACNADLLDAVPKVAHWCRWPMPRYLPRDQVEKVIAACDTHTARGRRDRAILLLLARLGLRAADVLALRLDNVDWRKGRIRVVGKARREAWLPLPQDVGDAILAYLRRGRPPSDSDHVFLRARAPVTTFREGSAIACLVRRAIVRAGVKSPSYGAHLLRHSVAAALLRDGATLDMIGALLRHRSIFATAAYAKVDVQMLREIAQPWPTPKVTPC